MASGHSVTSGVGWCNVHISDRDYKSVLNEYIVASVFIGEYIESCALVLTKQQHGRASLLYKLQEHIQICLIWHKRVAKWFYLY